MSEVSWLRGGLGELRRGTSNAVEGKGQRAKSQGRLPFALCPSLRPQPFDYPGSILLQSISQTIVQAVLTALPKLDRGRLQSITAPMRWPRNVVAELPTEFLESFFKFRAALKDRTLLRSPGANFASQRS